jgi:hypothetical protein
MKCTLTHCKPTCFWSLILTLVSSMGFVGCSNQNEIAAAQVIHIEQTKPGMPTETPDFASKNNAEDVIKEYVALAQQNNLNALSKLIVLERYNEDKPITDADQKNGLDTPGFGILYAMRKKNLEEDLPKLILEARMEIKEIHKRKVLKEIAEFAVVLRSKIDPDASVTELFRLKKVNKAWKIIDIQNEIAEGS